MTSPRDPEGGPGPAEADDRETSLMGGWWRKENEDPVAGYQPGEASQARWPAQDAAGQWGQGPGPAGHGSPYAMKPPNDGVAIGSLVVGIASLVFVCLYVGTLLLVGLVVLLTVVLATSPGDLDIPDQP